MKETNIRREVYRMLHKDLGLWPITQTDALPCPKCHTLSKPPMGRPDILVLNTHAPSAVIEVKVLNLLQQKSFAFNSVTPQQSTWLTRWTDADGLGYLAIGTVGVRPRRLWIIDWWRWQDIKINVTEVQDSLPYIAGKGFSKHLQEFEWDMDRLLRKHELERKTGGWVLPPWHSLLTLTRRQHEPS